MKCTHEHVLKMTEKRGWFKNQLVFIESLLNGRWSFWTAIMLNGTIGELPEWAIPQLNFSAGLWENSPGCGNRQQLAQSDEGKLLLNYVGGGLDAKKHVLKIFEKCMYAGSCSLIDLIEWWLWAFGSPRIKSRPRLPERAAIAMYSELQLQRMIGNPTDWGSIIATEFIGGGKRGTAWFPTPVNIVKMMVQISMGDSKEDTRLQSVNDPCVGTGVMLLEASNYSLDLTGQDIDLLMVRLCEFAGWLFVPWMVCGDKSKLREFQFRDMRRKFDPIFEILKSPKYVHADETEKYPDEEISEVLNEKFIWIDGEKYPVPAGGDPESTREALTAVLAGEYEEERESVQVPITWK